MRTSVSRIDHPELFVGFVSPIGADLTGSVAAFRRYFQAREYRVVEIKVTNVFRVLKHYIPPVTPLAHRPLYERYVSHIAYGNQLRAVFDDKAALAASSIRSVMRKRLQLQRCPEQRRFSRTVYLLHQFKRKEEIDLLRSVYGANFYHVSVYSRRGARVDFLSRVFASSENTAESSRFRSRAEEIIQVDENEVVIEYGQRVGKVFHDADFIVNLDMKNPTVDGQVDRFCELIFSANNISPTRMEYGMFAAKAAALRTLDLSRQVGAAVFSEDGQIICLGSNEVPKAGGGTYWADGQFDDREHVRGYDSNDRRKREILREILKLAGREGHLDKLVADPAIQDSQFMDALEYGRIVHAVVCTPFDRTSSCCG